MTLRFLDKGRGRDPGDATEDVEAGESPRKAPWVADALMGVETSDDECDLAGRCIVRPLEPGGPEWTAILDTETPSSFAWANESDVTEGEVNADPGLLVA